MWPLQPNSLYKPHNAYAETFINGISVDTELHEGIKKRLTLCASLENVKYKSFYNQPSSAGPPGRERKQGYFAPKPPKSSIYQ